MENGLDRRQLVDVVSGVDGGGRDLSEVCLALLTGFRPVLMEVVPLVGQGAEVALMPRLPPSLALARFALGPRWCMRWI